MMRQNAKESFDRLTELLFQKYRENGDDVDALILAKQDRMGTDYDTAFEEFVADSMEAMLTDTNAAERIAGLKETDKTAWEKLKELVHKLLESIRGLYEQYSPSSVEDKHVREMGDALEKLSDLFVEGMGKAGEQGTSEGKRDAYFSYSVRNPNDSNYDSESASIKEQIEQHRDLLNRMDVVASLSVPTDLKTKDSAATWAAERLKSTGYRVDRQGFGMIFFSKKDLDKGLRYADTAEERAAIAALPQVLKRGKEIGGHRNHKNRNKQTVTFAAPVELNGVRGNMGVVVNMNGGHYYAHRIALPDGTVFKFSEQNENAAQELSRGVTVSGSLADTTSAASADNVPQQTPVVNPKNPHQERGTSNREILTTALESAAQNPREREVLAEYKAAIDTVNEYEERLAESGGSGFYQRVRHTPDETHRLPRVQTHCGVYRLPQRPLS